MILSEKFMKGKTMMSEKVKGWVGFWSVIILVTTVGGVGQDKADDMGGAKERTQASQSFRRLPLQTYRDKMQAGWIGQMAGVTWGAPTEFKYNGIIIPQEQMPAWEPNMINNVFGQDDLYVEMTFLGSLEKYGLDVTGRQAGIDFANSRYELWHANKAARDNLRQGIAPPDSSHPQFNPHADDIDFQIEADFAGLIAPGLADGAIQLAEKFGRIMNYGDGLYGGQFVAAMYTEAFFENDPLKIVLSGLKAIPPQSQYAQAIRDTIAWYEQYPHDWQKTWRLINEKYQLNPNYRRFSCDKGDINIDAKINGAYIVMGLLYGGGDPDQTIIIATRCGQDSDCNPSNAAGILFTTIGYANLPERFKKVNRSTRFSYTEYNFFDLINVSEKLTRHVVIHAEGRIEKGDEGEEIFVIPVLPVKTGSLEQSYQPGPIANSRFTEAEMKLITKE